VEAYQCLSEIGFVARVVGVVWLVSKLLVASWPGFRVILENLMWCLDSISQSGIGWKPSLIRAFRNKGLACSAAESLAEVFIADSYTLSQLYHPVWLIYSVSIVSPSLTHILCLNYITQSDSYTLSQLYHPV
jgi:hypothetical protein